MAPSKLELAISALDVLVLIAKAVPVLGSTTEGSLEAAKKILEYAQVRLQPVLEDHFLTVSEPIRA